MFITTPVSNIVYTHQTKIPTSFWLYHITVRRKLFLIRKIPVAGHLLLKLRFLTLMKIWESVEETSHLYYSRKTNLSSTSMQLINCEDFISIHRKYETFTLLYRVKETRPVCEHYWITVLCSYKVARV